MAHFNSQRAGLWDFTRAAMLRPARARFEACDIASEGVGVLGLDAARFGHPAAAAATRSVFERDAPYLPSDAARATA
jgi:hypothetical protein